MALSALCGVASAAPTVTLKAKPVPIPHFRHTGFILGAGAALETEFRISGTEYGGYPPPVMGVNVFLPAGTQLHTAGFPTCPTQIIEKKEPERCPPKSSAGPVGHAYGFVVFGTERVPETVSVEGFYAAGGGINFVALGHTPASIEVVSKGHYTHLHGGGVFGPEVVVEVPLVQTVPGAADASIEKIVTKFGSAIKKGKKTLYYGTLPKTCPRHFLTIRAEVIFAENGNILTPVRVPVEYKAPCPRK